MENQQSDPQKKYTINNVIAFDGIREYSLQEILNIKEYSQCYRIAHVVYATVIQDINNDTEAYLYIDATSHPVFTIKNASQHLLDKINGLK